MALIGFAGEIGRKHTMKLQDAIDRSANEPAPGDALIIVGSVEKDIWTEKVRVYPEPANRTRYILLDVESVDGDIVDLTDAYRKRSPSLRTSIFSVPVKKGSTFQIINSVDVKVDDVAALSKLSIDQLGGGGCSCKSGANASYGCYGGQCTTVAGEIYPCKEGSGEFTFCSNCCVAVAPDRS